MHNRLRHSWLILLFSMDMSALLLHNLTNGRGSNPFYFPPFKIKSKNSRVSVCKRDSSVKRDKTFLKKTGRRRTASDEFKPSSVLPDMPFKMRASELLSSAPHNGMYIAALFDRWRWTLMRDRSTHLSYYYFLSSNLFKKKKKVNKTGAADACWLLRPRLLRSENKKQTTSHTAAAHSAEGV